MPSQRQYAMSHVMITSKFRIYAKLIPITSTRNTTETY